MTMPDKWVSVEDCANALGVDAMSLKIYISDSVMLAGMGMTHWFDGCYRMGKYEREVNINKANEAISERFLR